MNIPGDHEDRLRLVVQLLGVTIAAFALGIVVGLTILVVLDALAITLADTTLLVVNLIALQGIAFPVTAVVYLRWRGRSLQMIPVQMPSMKEIGIVVGGWIGTLVLVSIFGGIITAIGGEGASNQAGETALEHPEFIPYLIPLVFLLNGPGEELLFRGVIQGTFRERFTAPSAIILASLMFAPAHLLALSGSLQAMLVTISILLVPSLVFGTLYELTDNFVVPSLVHSLYNATLFGLIYVYATTDPPLNGAALLLGL